MSWLATDVLADPDRPVVYGSQGGTEPGTMEWLVLERSGRATYAAANPWPRSAPFDEIGTYAAAVDSLPDLLDLARVVAASEVTARTSSSDAGIDYLDMFIDGQVWSGEWVAQRAPDAVGELVDRLRATIDVVRAHPLRTLRAALVRGGYGARLRLENRGTEPFRFHGFGTGSDASSVHGRIAPSRPGETVDRASSDDPLRLAHAPRFDVAGPAGAVALAGGDSIELPIERLDTGGRVECLVHVRFEHESVHGDRHVDDGWIWPHSLLLEAT
jgi:hypothetical protein